MTEIETGVHYRNANARACPAECAWSSANPLHTSGHNLGVRRNSRRGDLGGIRIGRLPVRVESSNAIRIGCLTLEARVAQGSDIDSDLSNLDKAAAACHWAGAALDSEAVFVARIVGPAQFHLAVGDRRRGQTARCCRRWWSGAAGVVAFGDIGIRRIASCIESQHAIAIDGLSASGRCRCRSQRSAPTGENLRQSSCSRRPCSAQAGIRLHCSNCPTSSDPPEYANSASRSDRSERRAAVAAARVVASAILEYAELPPALNASTR